MLTRIKTWWTMFRFRHIALEVLVSLCLAFLVWLYTHSRGRTSVDQVQIPVQIQLNANQRDLYALEIPGPTRVGVSFTGPSSRIRELRKRLQRGSVQVSVTLSVPEEKLNENSISETVRVHASEIPAPPGVIAELTDENATIPVVLHRLAERELPVRLDFVGDSRVWQIKITPEKVKVRGPKAVLERTAAIQTQSYSLPVSQEQTSVEDTILRGQVALVNDLEGRPIQTSPGIVQFSCHAASKHKIYELKDVPVHFLCPAGFAAKPRFLQEKHSKVSLRVLGPASDEPPTVTAFVDLTSGTYARGRNLEPLRLQLPKDFQLVQPNTAMVAFSLEEPERLDTTSERLH